MYAIRSYYAALSLLVERGLQRTESLVDAWVRVGAEDSRNNFV